MTRLYILGGGTPTPTPERFGSSYVVDLGSERLMFDCGPAATHKLVKLGLRPTDIGHLFFTHHHFDHDVDYPCFLLTRWDQGAGREAPLRVFGPAPTTLITERLIGEQGAFAFDWRARVELPLSQQVYVNRGGILPRRPPTVDVHDVGAGLVLQTSRWSVTSAIAEHAQPWLDSLAYRIDTEDLSIVITGDTQPCASVVELAKGADVILSMCWDAEEEMVAKGEAVGQSGTLSSARMAAEAGVKKLVLVHMGPNIAAEDQLAAGLSEIARVYDGPVIAPRELSVLEL